ELVPDAPATRFSPYQVRVDERIVGKPRQPGRLLAAQQHLPAKAMLGDEVKFEEATNPVLGDAGLVRAPPDRLGVILGECEVRFVDVPKSARSPQVGKGDALRIRTVTRPEAVADDLKVHRFDVRPALLNHQAVNRLDPHPAEIGDELLSRVQVELNPELR